MELWVYNNVTLSSSCGIWCIELCVKTSAWYPKLLVLFCTDCHVCSIYILFRTTHDCIEEAVLPTLRTLFNAPNSSPLASVKVNNVAELLVYLTKPSIIKSLHTDANKGSSDSWKQRINWVRGIVMRSSFLLSFSQHSIKLKLGV